MEKQKWVNFLCNGNEDIVLSYIKHFKNTKGLMNVPFFDKSGELFDLHDFYKLENVSFSMSNPNSASAQLTAPSASSQLLSIEEIDAFVQKMAPSVEEISFNYVDTIEQLKNVHAIVTEMKKTREKLETHVSVNFSLDALFNLKGSNPALFEWVKQDFRNTLHGDFNKLIHLNQTDPEFFEWIKKFITGISNANLGIIFELGKTNPEFFEWMASKITYLGGMDFLQHEDQMHLFANVTNIMNFQITNTNGTLNRSLFSKLNRFNELQQLHFSCFKWGQSIPDNTLDSTSFDVIVDQLPRSLQAVSIYNLSTVSWDDFEPFVETLATRRPELRIDMHGSRTILEGLPRMMSLVESGRIAAH
ncbi:MAG: hypothetical protein NWS47_03355 [Alphaproteobacteria bacterium]|nr:hypothetical protein [Alphaproteobacteria bacterium]